MRLEHLEGMVLISSFLNDFLVLERDDSISCYDYIDTFLSIGYRLLQFVDFIVKFALTSLDDVIDACREIAFR